MARFLQGLDRKMAILLIEHDMDIVFDVADEISVLHFGEVLESGSAERIRSSAKVQEIYLGTADMTILDVQDIHTYYGDAYVLQGLSLKLEQGQILGLLGRNGVGKTTIVNSIVGFTPPRRGKIYFKGCRHHRQFLVRHRAQRRRAGAAGPPGVSDAQRRGQSLGRRAQPRAPRLGPATGLCAVPAAARAPRASAPRRCPAASSRCSPSAAG